MNRFLASAPPEDTHRDQHGEGGFTVLRLLVVCGALLLLLGVGGVIVRARTATRDHIARSHAEAAATAASHLADETGQPPTAEQLAEYEPGLEYQSLKPGQDVAVQGKVYVRVQGEVAELAARSGNTCYWVQETPTGRRYATGACDGNPDELHFASHW